MWIKNTSGSPDAMLTFATVGFLVVTANIILGSLGGLSFGGLQLDFQFMGSDIMAAYLGATFTAYVTRRYTDKKYDAKPDEEGE